MPSAGNPQYIGVDWASSGWLAVAVTTGGIIEATVYDTIERLWEHYVEAEQILVDVPIGLPSANMPTRRCDTLARQVTKRGSSVFPPPARAALNHDDHASASEANRDAIGKGLSVQTYHIADSIAEVDDLLKSDEAARNTVREAHPEVCLRAFAGELLVHSKKTAGGYSERLDALDQVADDPETLVRIVAAETAGDGVGIDDVVDALALALTARPGCGDQHTLPPEPPTDADGLPMEMVYRAPTPITEST